MGCPISRPYSRPYSSAYYSSCYDDYDDYSDYGDYDYHNCAYERYYYAPRARVRVGANGGGPRWRLVGGGGAGPWGRGRECCDGVQECCDGTVAVVGGFLA